MTLKAVIKERILREIKPLFDQQEKDYYKSVRSGNSWNKNYAEYERSGDRNKKLSVKDYLIENKPYFRYIIVNLQKSDTWKIQLTIAINFISSIDVEKERVMHSSSNIYRIYALR